MYPGGMIIHGSIGAGLQQLFIQRQGDACIGGGGIY
jgi:hypothetical protein